MGGDANGKPSVTHYDTLEAHRAASLLEMTLETGRTHQIRVHMAAMRHPCVGDLTYGADPTLAARLGLSRQWLHAVRLAFDHPTPASGSSSPAAIRTTSRARWSACARSHDRDPSRRRPPRRWRLLRGSPRRLRHRAGGARPTSSATTWTCDADHLVAYDGDRAVGAGRLVVEPAGLRRAPTPPSARWATSGRLAVRAEARGAKLGVALVLAIEERARERGLGVMALSSQTYAIPFYERLGYAAHGPEFDDAGLPHRWMRRAL